MWSRCKNIDIKGWAPNHFVSCIAKKHFEKKKSDSRRKLSNNDIFSDKNEENKPPKAKRPFIPIKNKTLNVKETQRTIFQIFKKKNDRNSKSQNPILQPLKLKIKKEPSKAMQEKLQTNENKKKGKKKEEKKKKLGASIYSSKFDQNWSVQWPFIQPVQGDIHSFYCTICSFKSSCSHQGMYVLQAGIK